jgi:hypothetical protein
MMMQKMHGAYDWMSSTSKVYADHTASEFVDLPERLQISYGCDRNPWENLFMQDFIMVAEFSEHEGPRPLVSSELGIIVSLIVNYVLII